MKIKFAEEDALSLSINPYWVGVADIHKFEAFRIIKVRRRFLLDMSSMTPSYVYFSGKEKGLRVPFVGRFRKVKAVDQAFVDKWFKGVSIQLPGNRVQRS
jgi:hypothetical protein